MAVPEITIEVVLALPERQSLKSLTVPQGLSVGEIIRRSGLAKEFPEVDLDDLAVGIWGREVARNVLPQQGDRVELYRPLLLDPREARRQLAQIGRTMSGGSAD